LTKKETRDRETLIKLRDKGIITTLGGLFALSCRKEINRLLTQGVFKLISNNSREISKTRIFGLRIVNKVKGKGTATLYKKSRLII
jgi:hypothetical protein